MVKIPPLTHIRRVGHRHCSVGGRRHVFGFKNMVRPSPILQKLSWLLNMDVFGSWCLICEKRTCGGMFCSIECLKEEHSRISDIRKQSKKQETSSNKSIV